MLDVEDSDGVLDGGGDAAGHGSVGRDDVADGAAEEHVAGLGLEDEVRDDAGVGAGDEEDVGFLEFSEEMEVVFESWEDFAAEFGVAGEEALHGVSSVQASPHGVKRPCLQDQSARRRRGPAVCFHAKRRAR